MGWHSQRAMEKLWQKRFAAYCMGPSISHPSTKFWCGLFLSVIVLHGVLDALMCFCMHMVHLNNNNISCACSVLCGHMAGLGRLYSHFHPSISVDCRACAVCHQCVTSLTLAVKLADMHVCSYNIMWTRNHSHGCTTWENSYICWSSRHAATDCSLFRDSRVPDYFREGSYDWVEVIFLQRISYIFCMLTLLWIS